MNSEVKISPDLPALNKVAVIGAGTMGRGIAISFANAGKEVYLLDLNDEARAQADIAIRDIYAGMVKRERISQQQADERLSLFTMTSAYDDIKDANLVIEAVYENLDLKCSIFKQLDEVMPADTVLATNTSYLDIDIIANATSRPERVLGLHFFSPAHIMKLLEIVRGDKTHPAVIEWTRDIAVSIGKVAVVAGNCYGFIGNRMIQPYVFQGRRLVLEGATPVEVDNALQNFGMAMGPFRMYDVVGIDLEWRARQLSNTVYDSGSPEELNTRIDDAMCEREWFGQKVGQGYYQYKAGSRTPERDTNVEELLSTISIEAGFQRRTIGSEEIIDRCILSLVNEGAKLLSEGIAESSADIDTVYLNGYGFPADRKGPMSYADNLGLTEVLKRLRVLADENGERFEPAPLIVQLAETDQKFSDYK